MNIKDVLETIELDILNSINDISHPVASILSVDHFSVFSYKTENMMLEIRLKLRRGCYDLC